ncbi:MAG TPA: FG-GAP repeat protein, partial [Arenibaculum sp.]|nr:FG-GAP repeat protein [Arenibaculum sp.]
MRSMSRFVLGLAALVAAMAGFRAEPEAANAATGGGGAVLVGDGEVFVGEPANQFRPGLVYVYRKSGTGWAEVAKLSKPDAAVGDRFGSSLTLDGTRLFVGAGGQAVHIFDRQGTTWTHVGKVEPTAVTGAENVQFGAIGASGDWLFVGQTVVLGGRGGRGAGANAAPPPFGRVYAFKRNASGGYDYSATLASPEIEASGDGFGSAIGI